MASDAREGTGDLGIGVATILGVLAVGGAVVMYLNPGTPTSGWGFAFAMLAASLAIVAAHAYR